MAKELYVGHISENACEEDVLKLFSVMGEVTSVHLIVDPETMEFKRCGYVRMSSDVDLKEVVETLDGALLVDRVITVSIARPQKPGMSSRSGKPGARSTGQGGRGSFGGGAGRATGESNGASRGAEGIRSRNSGSGPKRDAAGGGQGRSAGSAGQGRKVGGTAGPDRTGGGMKKSPRKGR